MSRLYEMHASHERRAYPQFGPGAKVASPKFAGPNLAARTLRHAYTASQGPTNFVNATTTRTLWLSPNLFIETMSTRGAVWVRHAMQPAPRRDSPRCESFIVLRTLWCRAESHCARRGWAASSCAASRVTPCTVTQVKPRRSSHAVPCELCRASRVALGRAVSHASCVVSCESRHVAPCESRHVASRRTRSSWASLVALCHARLGRAVCGRASCAPPRCASQGLRQAQTSATANGTLGLA
jgi:hypothetical protein